MENIQKWILENDYKIKDFVAEAIKSTDINYSFKGYYIEPDHMHNMGPSPYFENLKDDRKTSEPINHVRYFYELFINESKHTLTVHFYPGIHFLSSIGELHYEINESFDELKKEYFTKIAEMIETKLIKE